MVDFFTRYKKLKKRLQVLGLVIPGRLRTTYQRCGTANCKCKTGRLEDRHGPYIFWDKKLSRGLSSTSIKPKLKKHIQQGIQNRKILKKIVAAMLKLGEEYAKNLK